jgi:hypothetical protein
MLTKSAMSHAGGGIKDRRDEIVVFSIVRDSICADCGTELRKGQFLRVESDRPLCLSCADLDHLVFQPAGDAALTRRAVKYSKLRAVVVRFSSARKRYERQGMLVEQAALERAEQECLADSDARQTARARAVERRARIDDEYVKKFEQRIGDLFPACPPSNRCSIAEHACEKYSGRVGRTAAAKEFYADAIELAVRAHVRHRYTRYDALLAQGTDRRDARVIVGREVDEMLQRWRGALDPAR